MDQFCTSCNRKHPLEYFRKNGKYEHNGEQRYYNQCKYSQMGIAVPEPLVKSGSARQSTPPVTAPAQSDPTRILANHSAAPYNAPVAALPIPTKRRELTKADLEAFEPLLDVIAAALVEADLPAIRKLEQKT